jgi:hypothetical protein
VKTEPVMIPTKTVRWIKRDGQVVLQQWYENPITPTRAQLEGHGGPWCVGEFRDQITPVLSETL